MLTPRAKTVTSYALAAGVGTALVVTAIVQAFLRSPPYQLDAIALLAFLAAFVGLGKTSTA
ncbi:MAG: hypothetical protein HYX53_11555 [Chloroflexi bacterium]|nr:hypothetical protein [Chloroflexota bacterium]